MSVYREVGCWGCMFGARGQAIPAAKHALHGVCLWWGRRGYGGYEHHPATHMHTYMHICIYNIYICRIHTCIHTLNVSDRGAYFEAGNS